MFLSITDGRIARFDSKTSPEIEGIYTDNFSSCNIIIIYLNNNGHIKISMIHGDESIVPSDIAAELSWVGEGSDCIVVRRDEDFSQRRKNAILGKDFAGSFREIICEDPYYGVSINIQGEVDKHDSDIKLPQLVIHPQELMFTAVYKLNLSFKGCVEGLKLDYCKLLFDGGNWQPLREHDLKPIKEVQDCIDVIAKNIKKEPSLDPANLERSIKEHIKWSPYSCYMTAANLSMLAMYINQYIRSGDYQIIMQNRLLYIFNEGKPKGNLQQIFQTLQNLSVKNLIEYIYHNLSEVDRKKILSYLGNVFTIGYHAVQTTEFQKRPKSPPRDLAIGVLVTMSTKNELVVTERPREEDDEVTQLSYGLRTPGLNSNN